MRASARTRRWLPGLAVVMGCTGASERPPAGEPTNTPPTERVQAPAPEPDQPSVLPTAAPPRDKAEDEAWRLVDRMFDHVVGVAPRSPLLAGLDDGAIERSPSGVRQLSFQWGVRSFEPDPSCDSRAKCPSIPVWSAAGGVYVDLRAHRDQHAAGAFDAVHSIGPITVEVRVFSSDAVLRSSLLRDIRILAGARAPARDGCTDPVDQAQAFIRDEQRERGMADADRIEVEPTELTPFQQTVDLDGDGRPELVLAHLNIGRNTQHFFYVEREGCSSLIGVIDFWGVSGVGCRRDPAQPLCELHVNQLMVHGDQQSSTWRFDGERYVKVRD